jgi:uncharacterized membrane protein
VFSFSFTDVAAIADGTVYSEPNVTVMGPPTGIAVIPALLEPVTVIEIVVFLRDRKRSPNGKDHEVIFASCRKN